MREAAFSVIADFFDKGGVSAAESLAGLSFCDLYAGSGAVGLEAASRGASPVLLVERDKRTAALARANAANLGLAATVVTAAVEKFVETPPSAPFSIVWLDPPYELSTETVNLVVSRLSTPGVGSSSAGTSGVGSFVVDDLGWLAPDSLVVVERSSRTDPVSWPEQLPDRWTRRYGETTLYIGAKEA